jgi:hypothetical protein
VALAGCGGASASGEPEPADPANAISAEERAEDARAMLVEGRLDEAHAAAVDALSVDPEQPIAREVAARVLLARGEMRETVELLSSARRPRLVRLRARARARLGDYAGVAADLSSVEEREPADGWAEAMLPVARAAPSEGAFSMSGAARAAIPMDTRAPVPVIPIEVDGRATNALVATSADVTVLDDQIRATPGFAEQIALGELSVRNVPVLSRDLDPIGETLGTEIGAVIGMDLMSRLEVTLDGREREIVFRREGTEASAEASEVPFVAFEATFLAVRATLNGTVDGWFTLDTSGLFPVAIAPDTVEALDLDPESLEPAPGAPSPEIRMTTLERVRFGDVEMAGVPAVTGLVPADLSELAGAPIAGMLGAAMVHQLSLTIAPERRVLLIE